MHEKIEKLSSLIDKLIEQNFKLKTETKSLKNRVEQQERKIDSLEKENQSLALKNSKTYGSEQFSAPKLLADFLKFDLKVLNSYLQEHCPEIDKIIEYKQFKGGQSNPSYLLKSISKSYVLRRKPPGKLLKSAHAVDREYRVLTALMNTGFPLHRLIIYVKMTMS